MEMVVKRYRPSELLLNKFIFVNGMKSRYGEMINISNRENIKLRISIPFLIAHKEIKLPPIENLDKVQINERINIKLFIFRSTISLIVIGFIFYNFFKFYPLLAIIFGGLTMILSIHSNLFQSVAWEIKNNTET